MRIVKLVNIGERKYVKGPFIFITDIEYICSWPTCYDIKGRRLNQDLPAYCLISPHQPIVYICPTYPVLAVEFTFTPRGRIRLQLGGF